ncbi:MAG TPA: nucleotidyl transferase AbiEii/AbiGii toxin family protein, partial [Pirellulales bacterium]
RDRRLVQRWAIDLALGAVHDSPWRDELILRGSLLLKTWYGPLARDPNDVDWVVASPGLEPDDPGGQDLIAGLVERLQQAAAAASHGDLQFAPDGIRWEEIYEYDQAPGMRITLPWNFAGHPPGETQLDFVFREELWTDPAPVVVPRFDGGDLTFQAATPEQSLAWKIQWLDGDETAKGQDLYDAVLLAERVRLPFELLERAFLLSQRGRWRRGRAPRRGLEMLEPLRKTQVDWNAFKRRYPTVRGESRDWIDRLIRALTPTVA